MGGLAVLFLIGLYFVLAVIAIVKVKSVWAKGVVLLAALLIPTADAIYGRIKLQEMCEAEGGLKVYRVAHGVEGFVDFGTHSDYWVSVYGYQFAENRILSGTTTRYSKQNGQVIQENQVTPKSQYRAIFKDTGDTVDRYSKNQFIVETMQGEILATDTQTTFNGGWAERFLAQFSGSGGGAVAWCKNTELDPVKRNRNLVLRTLKHSGE